MDDGHHEALAVLGAGTMGHSIALAAALAAWPVRLWGVSPRDLETARRRMLRKLDTLTEEGALPDAERGRVLARIDFTESQSWCVEGAALVVEATPEDLGHKQAFFRAVEPLCGPDAIIASNSSGLSPTAIFQQMTCPTRGLVMHFWNPAHLMPLVEVVPGHHTTRGTVSRALDSLRQMGKQAIVVRREVPGYLGNRLQYALFREAQYLLEQGVASAADIDLAAELTLGRRLGLTGPFRTADMGGLDVFHAISGYLFPSLSTEHESGSALRALVDQGALGEKAGRGFYAWSDEASRAMERTRERDLIRWWMRDRGSADA
ncbi:MAG: 3-hydroxyacyl-CoA dehydrogenase family protein [Thermaerobacter sp.]|nr:3-hydroxyacyl-CoA dehydrogenase family protein [Thermaerobacter sp.]